MGFIMAPTAGLSARMVLLMGHSEVGVQMRVTVRVVAGSGVRVRAE